MPSAGEGATLESGPAVAGGGARSSRRYGNIVGREVVGHMGGLVTTSTDRGDGRWLVATNEANPYFRLGGGSRRAMVDGSRDALCRDRDGQFQFDALCRDAISIYWRLRVSV